MEEEISDEAQAKEFMELSDEKKVHACYAVRQMDMETDSVSKQTLKVMMDWLFDKAIRVEKPTE